MAERERFGRPDLRSVGYGLRRALAVTVFLAVAGTIVRAVILPVVRDLAGDLPVPGYWHIAIFATGVGLFAGWSRMRATRRVRSRGLEGDLRPGARALAIARAGIADNRGGSGAPGGSAGVPVAVPVQRWSSDLLSGRDLLPGKAGLTDDD